MQLNLKLRKLTMKDFIRVMRERKTSGMDITLLSLCEMLHISILVLFEDMVWKSHDLSINDFHVYMIMFKGGRFIAATPRSGYHMKMHLPYCCKDVIQTEESRRILRDPNRKARQHGEPTDSSSCFSEEQETPEPTSMDTSDCLQTTPLTSDLIGNYILLLCQFCKRVLLIAYFLLIIILLQM